MPRRPRPPPAGPLRPRPACAGPPLLARDDLGENRLGLRGASLGQERQRLLDLGGRVRLSGPIRQRLDRGARRFPLLLSLLERPL